MNWAAWALVAYFGYSLLVTFYRVGKYSHSTDKTRALKPSEVAATITVGIVAFIGSVLLLLVATGVIR